jgi:hypothetical protein
VPLGYRRMFTTLSGRHTHHKDGAKLFVYGVTVVVVVDVVDVVEVLVEEVVVDGFTVDDVEDVELLVELDVELVDEVDPRFVPSSVG